VNEFRKEMNYEHTKVGGFAFPQPVSVNAEKDGKWIDGVWTYTFVSTDDVTKGMFVAFDGFWLPEGSSLFTYTETGEIAGAFTSKNNKKNQQFMIRPLSGKKLTVEYNANGATEQPIISIDVVGQAYASFPGHKFGEDEKRGPSGWCNINTACSCADDWRNEINAVTVLMSSFGGYCSGSMINNPDGKQYYLTAYHCRPSSRDLVGFNYQESTCNGNDNSLQITDTAQGLATLASGSGSDYHLMEVEETIPSSYNAYLAGWNANEASSYTDVTCISHPSIDRKKFTQHYGGVTRSGYISSNGDTHWYVSSWELGTTEGGSSGSPLFNANKQIIGQLHGGYASCNYNYDDYYGALVKSYSALTPYLGSSGSMSGAYL
jgi:V8-like Glu-specific endopeptidase